MTLVQRIRGSIAAQVLGAMAAMAIVLVLSLSGFEIWRDWDLQVANEHREAQAAARANVDTLALALWAYDQRALEVTARSLINGTSIFRVEIRDDDKTQLTLDRSKKPLNLDFMWEIPLVRPNTNETIGSLRVWENYDDVRAQVETRAAVLVVTELTKIVVISVLLYFVVHRVITRPLAELARKVQSTGGNGEPAKITVSRALHKGHDEIDALVEAINSSSAERMRLESEQRRMRERKAHAGKLEALGQMAGGVAHDFNNILGAIQGFGGLLAQDIPTGSMQHRFVQRILSACNRGKELVEQIRAFARAEGPERRIVDLRDVMLQSESLLSASLPSTTQLKFIYGTEDLPVFSSDARLGQLIANLCINGSEALEGRPGTVMIEAARAPIGEIERLQAQTPAPGERFEGKVDLAQPFARLRVSDTGSGIPDDILDRIFDPFFTTKGRLRGTGLGLAVVHGVIENHGGACHIVSRPGQGTVFSVYFPLSAVRAKRLAAAAPLPEADTLRGSERILIVDDEQDIVDGLSIGLGRLGYEVAGSCDPVAALAAFEEDPTAWDLLITDQTMPAMRGLELIAKVKAIRPAIRAVLCTGYSDNANEDVSLATGADAFLMKPLDAMRIAPVMRRLLDRNIGH